MSIMNGATARRAGIAAVALFIFSESARSQKPCEKFPPTADSVPVLIQLSLRSSEASRPIAALDADEILRAIAANLHLPAELSLPIFPGSSDSSLKVNGVNYAWPQFTGRVRFRVIPGGRVSETVLTVRSMTPGLERVLLHALEVVDSTRALNGMLIPKEGLSLEYQLVARERTDSLSLVLRRAKMPAYRVEHLVQPLRGGENVRPSYPETVRKANAEGFANFVFVVGENGAIVPGTAIQTNTTFRELSAAVIDVLPKLRFIPGVAGGCPINVWTAQKFDFQLTRN